MPSIIAVAWFGEKGTGPLLVFGQVVLSVQLSFAVIPLVQFTSDRAKMGRFANGPLTRSFAWLVALLIAGLNAYLVFYALSHLREMLQNTS